MATAARASATMACHRRTKKPSPPKLVGLPPSILSKRREVAPDGAREQLNKWRNWDGDWREQRGVRGK
ncbi:hypothetical protein JTE90_003752 [Oedothorax gibbosus]|uniref:Uncharacterized protein n=1 Tax=Oedothorax gibbosus TaxID=931172 RepID=A0AAV6VCC0_9ARAC|nr:hypothetical protein JTE90_003752 [Oedothorax gibbosus]